MEKENGVKTVVPALRFPEFREMEGWRKSYIYEECPNSYSGGTPKTTEKIFYGGNIPFIRSAEIGKNKTELYITQEGLNNSSAQMIQKGDLLIALYGANSGDIAIAKIDGAINQAILCLRAKENNLFIYYTLQKNKKNIVSKYLQGGQGNLSAEIIKSIVFYIPQKNEQQKIADCLSSLDDLIEATNRKIETLKEHKKGLMQRLFPKDGENVPELRFPEFRGMEGWRKSHVYEECPNSYSGGTPKTTEKIFYGGNIPFIRSAEIGKNKTELYITQEGLNNSSAQMIQKGDLLIALYGANSGDIAIAKIDGAINQAILCLRAKENNLFIYYTLQKNKKNIVSKYLQGGQGNLSAEIIKSIVFYMPQKTEQQKIADCLSSLDELIEATSRKVEILKEHKKGLMQQLFPKI